METIKGQTLFSTLEDSQGERRDKQFLEEILKDMPPRYPLGQHPDAGLPSIGYIDNFRVEQIPDQPGEWRLVGDVHIENGVNWSKGGGFSYSTTEIIQKQPNGVGVLYVPYPFYRDEKVIEELLSYDPQLNAGRWIKKAADPHTITLIVTLTLWTLTPLWKRVFDEGVWPFLERVLVNYRNGRFKDIPFDYGSTATGRHGEKVNIQLIPDRRNCGQTFTKELVKDGLAKAIKLIAEDKKGATVPIKLIKLYYHDQHEGYRVNSILYADGDEINLINKNP
jgi:hypothetical protein